MSTQPMRAKAFCFVAGPLECTYGKVSWGAGRCLIPGGKGGMRHNAASSWWVTEMACCEFADTELEPVKLDLSPGVGSGPCVAMTTSVDPRHNTAM